MGLILFNMLTPEGWFEGENGALDWHCTDADFNAFAIAQLEDCSGLLLGRKTFELLRDYWNSKTALANDPIVAKLMAGKIKYVVSKTLKTNDWNARCLNQNLLENLLELKQQPGNLLLLGSGSLANNLLELGLIDEYQLMINPVLIGGGKAFFRPSDRIKLQLLGCRTFESGNVLLSYRLSETPKYLNL